MRVINWQNLRPLETDVRALARNPGQSVHVRLLARNIVRQCLNGYPWQERTDLVPLFEPCETYHVGEQIALPIVDRQHLRPDTWRCGVVKSVQTGENAIQGIFQVVQLVIEEKEHWLAAGVKDAASLPFRFPPDEDEADFLVDDFVNHYLSSLIQVIDDLIASGKLSALRQGDQILYGIVQDIQTDFEPWFAELSLQHPTLSTDDIILRLWDAGELNDTPEELARILVEKTLHERNYVDAGGGRWLSPMKLAELDRQVSRRLEVPRSRSKIKALHGDVEELAAEDYLVLPEQGKTLLDDLDIESEAPQEVSAETWQPPTAPLKMPALSYLNIMQGYFSLTASLLRAFPPRETAGMVDVLLVDGESLPFIVNEQERMLKSIDPQAVYQRFVTDLAIPAGTFLWLEYQGENRYRIAPRSLAVPRPVRCKQAWLENGSLRVEDLDIEMRYEGDEHLFRAELRFEDPAALFREAEERDTSIFDAIYDVLPKLAALRPDGLVHYRDIFNAVFFEYRMCSYRTVIHELYDHACFAEAGNGFFRFAPELGVKRRRPTRKQIEKDFWKDQPDIDPKKPPLSLTAAEPEFWRQIATVIPRKLQTLDEHKPFEITTVTHETIELIVSTGHTRTLPRLEVEQAWNELSQRGQLNRGRVTEFANFNVAYVMAILAALPDVRYELRPLRLKYQVDSKKTEREPLSLPDEFAADSTDFEKIKNALVKRIGSMLNDSLVRISSNIRSIYRCQGKHFWFAYSRFHAQEDCYWFGLPKDNFTRYFSKKDSAFAIFICGTVDRILCIPASFFDDLGIESVDVNKVGRWLITLQPRDNRLYLTLNSGTENQRHIDVTRFQNNFDPILGERSKISSAATQPEPKSPLHNSGEAFAVERTRGGQLIAANLLPKEPLFRTTDKSQTREIIDQHGEEEVEVSVPSIPAEEISGEAATIEAPAKTPSYSRRTRASAPQGEEMQNKTLFSNNYLNTRLIDMREWNEDPLTMLEEVRALWQKAKRYCETWNEAQTEEEFIKPILKLLGWSYIVQAKASRGGQTTRPDYALFASEASKDDAQAFQGNDDAFYSRALAIAEAKHWGRPLSQKDASGRATWKAESNPSHQMVSYLVGTRAEWGILSNGQTWRLYSREVSSTASEFYEVDLSNIFDFLPAGSEPSPAQVDEFKRWWLFFRRAAFTRDAEAKPFVQRVHEQSAQYARTISDTLKELVFKEVMPEIAGGFIAYRYHQLGIGEETPESLQEIYRASLSLLYKLLFLLYAEARSLLPMNNSAYRANSLTAIAEWAAEQMDSKHNVSEATYATPRYDTLLALFRRIDQGDLALGIPEYNGGLFSPKNEANIFLERHKLSDQAVARAVDLLVRDQGEPVDYAFISVRNLGAIYEGLLENKLQVIDAPVGRVELVNDKGERKATGSYYTPDYIVEYIVHNTLDPILERRQVDYERGMERVTSLRQQLHKVSDPATVRRMRAELEDAEREAREAFLGIKVLDPAMGSGHFLVNAVDHLTDGIIQRMQAWHDIHLESLWEWDPIQQLIERVRTEIRKEMETHRLPVDSRLDDDTPLLTRLVMKRCIYGVDLNPMAVELARVSLWLHTFTVGAPLSFLDHHLRWGNSLIGVSEIEKFILPGTERWNDISRTLAAMVQISEMTDSTIGEVAESSKLYQQSRVWIQPTIERLNVEIAAHFADWGENPKTLAQVAQLAYQAEDVRNNNHGLLEKYEDAQQLAKDYRFFHWKLEFPEVFVDTRFQTWAKLGGFDAVIGNPPYRKADDDKVWQKLRSRIMSLQRFRTLHKKWDLYIPFIELAGQFTKDNGFFGLIVENSIEVAPYAEKIREFLFSGNELVFIDFFPGIFLFEEANVATTIFVTKKSTPQIPYSPKKYIHTKQDEPEKAALLPPKLFSNANQVFKSVISLDLDGISIPLGKLCYINKGATLQAHDIKYRGQFIKDDLISLTKDLSHPKPYIEGKHITDILPDGIYYLEYGEGTRNPSMVMEPRFPEMFENPKLIFGKTSGVVIDYDSLWCDQSGRVAVPFYLLSECNERSVIQQRQNALIDESKKYSLKYLLIIARSSLGDWFIANESTDTRDATPDTLKRLPVRRIDFTTLATTRLTELNVLKSLYNDEKMNNVLKLTESHLPERADIAHDLLDYLAGQMIEMNKARQEEVKGFLGWLGREVGTDLNFLPGKTTLFNYLGDYQKGEDAATLEDILAILRKNQRKLSVEVASRAFQERLEKEYDTSLKKLLPIKARLSVTDRLIDQIVYKLYGLSEEEIAIVEGR